MRLAVMQPYFLPYIGYFQLINAVDKFVIYDDVNFINRGWINRNNVLVNGSAQLFSLSLGKASQNKLINEICIIDDFKKFLRTIEMNYQKAPYFKKVFDLLQDIVAFPDKQVANFVLNTLLQISDYLHIDTEFLMSSMIEKDNSKRGQIKIIEMCHKLGANIYINPIGGQELYDRNYFKEEGIQLYFIQPFLTPYRQFKNDFVAGLSILDVLMFNSVSDISNMLSDYKLI